ncbi:MAG: c-type cytochrome [Gammaproteobacteria bacterium]|nr:c-type cytochrome [Gammaproteobacteria bacterium]
MSAENSAPSSGKILALSLGFSLLMVLVFTLVANLLPQIEGEASVEEEVELGALTMDSFIALGETLFNGKGTCTLCHNAMGRAPDILAQNMVGAAEERLADSRYKGKATDAESYLHESMVNPGIYVVAGFGKKGSNDTVSPMPAVHKAPIQLSEVEIGAIIAFMQAKDGNDVTVPLPTDAPVAEAEPEAPAAATSAEEALGKFGCTACHSVLESEATLGPSLKIVGRKLTAEEIRQSIIDPNAVIADGFSGGMMPANFADQMMVKELEMIIHFLAEQKG